MNCLYWHRWCLTLNFSSSVACLYNVFLLEVQESKYTTHRVLVMASFSFSFSSCLLSCHVYYSYLPSLNQSISETSSIVESISSLLIAKGRICKEEIHSQLVTCICIWFFLFFVKRVLIRSTFANRYLHQPSLYSHHLSSLYIKNVYITKCNLTFILICWKSSSPPSSSSPSPLLPLPL